MVEREARAPRGDPGVLLCADDFAMTNGVSRAIIELADGGRLSAVSAMTTTAHWPAHATWLARARGSVSAGLHLNLTLGAPLTGMATFAPNRRLPAIGQVTALALARRLPEAEIGAEIDRQLAAFENEIGFPPDHVDGHQHVHALPGVRAALFAALERRYPTPRRRPLLRDPGDNAGRVIRRGRGQAKAIALSMLAHGFAREARARGFAFNDGFAGVSDFTVASVGADFAAACDCPGPRHLVMCHPGFADEELLRIDPVTLRREAEFGALNAGDFPALIWRPRRTASGEPIDWPRAWLATP